MTAKNSDPRTDRRMEILRQIRANGPMPIGWGEGECSPVTANVLEQAGLAVIEVTEKGRFVKAKNS